MHLKYLQTPLKSVDTTKIRDGNIKIVTKFVNDVIRDECLYLGGPDLLER